MPDIDTLPLILSPHFYRGRRSRIRLAVMHTPEAPERDDTAEAIARYFQGSRRASTHLTGDNNSVVRCVFDGDTAFGAENANADGLHYELAGYAGQSAEEWDDPYSNAALILGADVFRQWCERYGLEKRRLSVEEIRGGAKGICGHADVYQALGGNAVRTDPGAHFPWAEFITLVNEGGSSAVTMEDDMSQILVKTENSKGKELFLLVGVPEAKQPLPFSTGKDAVTFAGTSPTPMKRLNLSRAEAERWLGDFPDKP